MAAPPGTRLAHTPDRGGGRSVFATRSYRPGDVIATFGKPILALPDGPNMRTTCNYCLTVQNPDGKPLRACTSCKAAVYCNPTCQRAHWKSIHKSECKLFIRVREGVGKDWVPTPTRAVAQVLMLLRAGDPATIAALGDDGSLVGNTEAFKKDTKIWSDYEMLAMAAVVYGGLVESEETLRRAEEILCKIQTNAFDRLDADTGMSGIFLDAGLSMINHSCIPNAFIGFDKRVATLRAERTIEEGDEIRISYIDHTLPKMARQEGLRLYHFQCDCPRCKDDLDVYQVCASSPAVPLNALSLQPDLARLRNPPVDRSKLSAAKVEVIYKAWHSPAMSEGGSKIAQQRWKLCKQLVEARMWAVEPLPASIHEVALICQENSWTWAYALPLWCFLATECEPFRLVAPFMPWRMKGVVMIAKCLSESARQTATGELARNCPHKGLVDILARNDQVTMCEALIRLLVHDAAMGAAAGWDIAIQAREMLQDIEHLDGRENESALIQAWVKNPEDPQANAFFRYAVLKPITELAALAIQIMDAELWASRTLPLVRR
ncbi:hypothetical protein B0H67DRAFT_475407 [Lasiosphaeris hirsuta]|uniref:Suppressor of anucleate metulae protein B n=1 Tax=Lasiosphaeris hirsuta TaxID=260670 RepID=A0AA40BAN3_9PEZI|nr:hypothetical protein B0H67DRAFT_475407 [Lasiosphaeris hirsuta]